MTNTEPNTDYALGWLDSTSPRKQKWHALRGEVDGLTFSAVYLDTKTKTNHWVAVWRTPAGNFLHERLDGVSELTERPEVEAYAKEHVPTW